MTLFTDGLIRRPDRNLLDDVVTNQFDAATTAFDQAMFDNPTNASRRINELTGAQDGPLITPAYPAYNIPEVRGEPETPVLPAEEARRRVAESGLDINIDETGIREGALDILLERKRDERQRQIVLQNAPTSTMPVQLLAGFAASAIDPINLASAFIPVVGEARYASMLASATSKAGRFAVRARVGAAQGAVGAAAVEPLILYASAQDQADYGITDSLLNVAFGTVLGGGLHATGGLITEVRQSKLLSDISTEAAIPDATPVQAVEAAPFERTQLADAISRGDESPMVALRESLSRAIEADKQRIIEEARAQAIDEFTGSLAGELEETISGRSPNVGTLRAEQAQVRQSLADLEDRFKPLAKELQGQRMSRKQAEKAAREAIEQERQQLTARDQGLTESLDGNRQAEIARAELSGLRRGELPERYAAKVDERAQQIAAGFNPRQTARAVAEAAPWHVRESALRSAVAQSMTGRPVDIEALFDLGSPAKRDAAMTRIKQPAPPTPDAEGVAISQRADQAIKEASSADELVTLQQSLADDLAIAQEMADQVGLDLVPLLRDADTLVNDATTFSAAFRAAAVCQLRS